MRFNCKEHGAKEENTFRLYKNISEFIYVIKCICFMSFSNGKEQGTKFPLYTTQHLCRQEYPRRILEPFTPNIDKDHTVSDSRGGDRTTMKRLINRDYNVLKYMMGRVLQVLIVLVDPLVLLLLSCRDQLCYPRLDNVQVADNVLFVRSQSVSLLQTLFGGTQISSFNVDDAEIVLTLHIHRVELEYS